MDLIEDLGTSLIRNLNHVIIDVISFFNANRDKPPRTRQRTLLVLQMIVQI